MKTSSTFFLTIIISALAVISCEKPSIDDCSDDRVKTCEMKLIGDITYYDDVPTRAISESTWQDGSVIHLRMDSPMGVTLGEATYNSSKDIWTVNYYGSLTEGVETPCSALYVEDAILHETSVFTFNENTAIFEDCAGSYIFNEDELVVTASLTPKTGRVRFSGNPGQEMIVYGITHYTTYDQNNNQYTKFSEPIRTTVNNDGFTPYIYGYFTDLTEPNLKLWIDAKEAYTRYFSNEVFKAGQSGKLTIPTSESHNGWADGLIFSVGIHKFKMIAVQGGTFIMGDTNSTSSGLTPHNVTLTGYCIAESEMTRGVYYNYSYVDNKPIAINRSYLTDGMTNLYNRTNVHFTVPSEAQWEFAAKGGVKSKSYKYAGSDNIDEVAWYSKNSEDAVHDVMLKLPNELGIYDMTGNQEEHVLDYYGDYTDDSVTDPVNTTSAKYHVIRGGKYSHTEDYCTNTNRIANIYYTSYNSYNDGRECAIRLTLNWN